MIRKTTLKAIFYIRAARLRAQIKPDGLGFYFLKIYILLLYNFSLVRLFYYVSFLRRHMQYIFRLFLENEHDKLRK